MAGRRSRPASSPPPPELPPDGDSSEEEEEEEDDEPVEPNLLTRVRRVNAGNRMAALLQDEQGAEADELFKEEENDVEFKQKEEEDVFDSDFGSTDEGSAGEDDDDEAGERRLEREAKAEAKAAKAKRKKGFVAPTHPFARTTKDQLRKAARASTSATATLDHDDENDPDDALAPRPAKRKKVTVDPGFVAPQRESARRSALEFKQGVQERLNESEKRRATAPKPKKKAARTLTQADLIAEALETEEVNRAALLAFYAAEEDRREAERVAGMRYEIIGPKLTFLSRTEGAREKQNKGKGKQEAGRRRMIEVLGESGQKGWKGGIANGNGGIENGTTTDGQYDENDPPVLPKDDSRQPLPIDEPVDTVASTRSSLDKRDANDPMPWTRNWLVFDQFEGTRAEEYEALFGDHVDWSQPLPPRGDRKVTHCALTGRPARYRDPRTHAPFASLEAYQVLHSIVDAQAFIWSDSLGAYTGTSGFGLAREVETAWSRRPAAASSKARYAAAIDAPPTPLAPMSAPVRPPPPPPRVSTPRAVLGSTALSSSSSSSKGKARASREDNPYVREYANVGGSGRGSRGRTSLSETVVPSPLSLSGPPTPDVLPPLPPAYGFPPLPNSTLSAVPATLPPLPTPPAISSYGGSAPQARQIQLSSSSTSSGFFGASQPLPHFSPNPTSTATATATATRSGSPFASSIQSPRNQVAASSTTTSTGTGSFGSPSLPPLPTFPSRPSASSPFPQHAASSPSGTLDRAAARQSPLPRYED
ncbi:hypothetical protein JCM10212_005125 [Sporobolomyces blumeae]